MYSWTKIYQFLTLFHGALYKKEVNHNHNNHIKKHRHIVLLPWSLMVLA